MVSVACMRILRGRPEAMYARADFAQGLRVTAGQSRCMCNAAMYVLVTDDDYESERGW